jgi:citrate lyase subunit beta/citryl-CoA lyase
MNQADVPVRSFLFVPASKTDWVRKAIRAAPDAVILDMEDAVPPAEKTKVRPWLQAEIAELVAARTLPVVRINPFGDGGEHDVESGMHPGLFAVVLPKVSSAEEIIALDRLLAYHEGRIGKPLGQTRIYPLPETARGLADARAVASASPRVQGLFTGVSGTISGDVARAFGFRPTEEALEQLYLQGKIVLDSRAAGAMHPIASIMATRISDLVATERMVLRAKQVGFTGAVLIHPSHVPVANRIFRPTRKEIDYYERMLKTFQEAESSGLGAVRFEDQMIDYAYLPLAKEIIAEGEALRNRGISMAGDE